MEILTPNFLEIAWRVAIVFSVLSAGVLAIIIGVRWEAQQKARRAENFRRTAEPLVTSFLARRADAAAAAAALAKDPDEACALLMDLSERLGPEDSERLRPLASALPMVREAPAGLKSGRWESRLQAAERLGYFGGPDAGPMLLEALADEMLPVRLAAARGLAALGDPSNAEAVLMAFDLPGDMNQRRVAEILFSFGPRVAPPLARIARNEASIYSDNAISTAARVLGMLRAADAVPVLTALLGHAEYRVRINAARALGAIGDRSSLPAIAALAADPIWEVRNVAVQALGKMRSASHAPLLTKALSDPSWWVRYSAGQALASLGDEGADILRNEMRTSRDRYATDMSRQVLEELRVRETQEAR